MSAFFFNFGTRTRRCWEEEATKNVGNWEEEEKEEGRNDGRRSYGTYMLFYSYVIRGFIFSGFFFMFSYVFGNRIYVFLFLFFLILFWWKGERDVDLRICSRKKKQK